MRNDPVSLNSKTLHDIRNDLNTIFGYSQILQDELKISDEQAKMSASIEKAALNIRSALFKTHSKTVSLQNDQNTTSDIKVLIVDDNEDNRSVLELILKRFGLKIFSAKSGSQAIKIAKEEKADLIFMDLHLPDMNGIKASISIKEALPDTKIFALSGDVEALKKESLNNTIFESCIEKPFSRNEIKEIVLTFTDDSLHVKNSAEEKERFKEVKDTNAQKILIVDDKTENLSLFKNILSQNGYKVKTASSGEEALRIVHDFMPELILLDIIMPNMNGYEVIRELKKSRSFCDIPVIFLTANDKTDDIVKGFEEGAVDYIAKPFHPRELSVRVNTHLQKAKLTANLKKLMEYSFHELYTPLSIITSAMQMQELEFKQTDYTRMTLAACKSLQNIYDDLYYSLNYSNKQSNKSSFDLSTLLLERIVYFDLIAQSRSLTFKTDLLPSLPLKLDQEDMKRVIDNLISNALKYTREGHNITVSLVKDEKRRILSICNPTDKNIDVEKIFQKYYRHDEEVFGLGLGLELVQSICMANDIDIRASLKNGIFCIDMEFTQTK